MIMERELKLKRNIMRRVYIAYALKTIFSQRAVKFIPLALIVAELTPFLPFVSLRNVITNMSDLSGFNEFYSFQLSAFLNTELVVQVSIVAVMCVLVMYVYNTFHSALLKTAFLRSGLAG